MDIEKKQFINAINDMQNKHQIQTGKFIEELEKKD